MEYWVCTFIECPLFFSCIFFWFVSWQRANLSFQGTLSPLFLIQVSSFVQIMPVPLRMVFILIYLCWYSDKCLICYAYILISIIDFLISDWYFTSVEDKWLRQAQHVLFCYVFVCFPLITYTMISTHNKTEIDFWRIYIFINFKFLCY